jgi:hypothetical protein
VLIHSPDPQSVVDEIARVLRVGARAMFPEPDHGSHVVATDEPEIFERIKRHRWTGFGCPFAGRHLAATVSRAGFEICRLWLTPILHTSLQTVRAAGGPFDRAVAACEADRYLASLEERDRDGTLVFAGIGVSVSARRV